LAKALKAAIRFTVFRLKRVDSLAIEKLSYELLLLSKSQLKKKPSINVSFVLNSYVKEIQLDILYIQDLST